MGNGKQDATTVKPTHAFKDIEKLEKDLWEAADNLRANSKLTSSDHFMPVLGVIFLRHAANRFEGGPSSCRKKRNLIGSWTRLPLAV
jgi:hypothetical protein